MKVSKRPSRTLARLAALRATPQVPLRRALPPPGQSGSPERQALARTVARGELGPVLEQARNYADKSRAPNTRKTYTIGWKQWLRWAKAHGVQACPAPPEAVALYITDRIQAGKSVNTIKVYLSAIAYYHKLAGEDSPTTRREVTTVFEGILRTHGSAPRRQARPVVTEQIRRILAAMPQGPPRGTKYGKPAWARAVRDRAIILLAFCGGFRRSELLALTAEDLDFRPEGVIVLVRRSKRDQRGLGRRITITLGTDAETCPVTALKAWIDFSGHHLGRIFELQDAEISRILRRRAKAAGLDWQGLSSHSFRAGLVTTATRAQIGDHRIMDQTGHKTVEMVRRYRREQDHLTDDFTKKLGL